MKKSYTHKYNVCLGKIPLLCAVIGSLMLASCNTTRRVPEGQYLLTHNGVLYSARELGGKGIGKKITSITRQQIKSLTISPEIAPQFILAYVKQKPNTKIVGLIPLHLLIYNLVNPKKAKEKKQERNQRIDEKNKRRIAAGKHPKSDEQIKAKKERRTFREWLMSVGEPPVILDTTLMGSSLKQVTLFLNSKGYFNCEVHDSVNIKKKKAKVFYIIRPGKPYKIDSVQYDCADTAMLRLVYADTVNCLINSGDDYDLDVLLKERDRITRFLNDNGYYAFTKEFIHFSVDTTLGGYRTNIRIEISKYPVIDTNRADSTNEVIHPVFHIRNVTIQMQYNPSSLTYSAKDTILAGSYKFVYPGGKIAFKPQRLSGKLFIKEGDLYKVSNVDYTYNGLTELHTFRYINIKIVPVGNNLLDCYIQLMPTVRQSIGVEAVYTNTGGDAGIQGDAGYENKNMFRGGEELQIKIKGGLEAQKILGGAPNNEKGINRIIQLNTIDIGPEIDFSIPRPLFPFNLGANIDSTHIFHHKFGLWPKANPQTVFKINYDYQNQPLDYQRHVFGLAYTFNYNLSDRFNRWHVELRLPEINYVYATVFPSFQGELIKNNNFFLLNSFTNHFIPDIGFTLTHNNQTSIKQMHYHFFKFDAEESGYLLRIIDGFPKASITPNPSNNYLILGEPYSYYVKFDADYRQYIVLSKDDKIAFRAFGGIGIPMAGVPQEMPFDKSFWGGGANDIRGWQARALGPGAYSQTQIVDQIGDIKLEANAEYRVNVIKLLGLALFVDAGNIWLLHANPNIPRGEFPGTVNDVINQVAVAGGVGVRLDFTYFVFRFDFGYPLLDPSKPLGEKLAKWHQLSVSKVVLNLGIGYPF